MIKYFVLLIILAVNISAQLQGRANLIIRTNSEVAEIFLNDESYGVGNLDVNVEPGEYYLYIREGERRAWGSETIEEKIILGKDEIKTLEFNFSRKLYVDSEPSDAYIMKGGKIVGHTPLFISPELKNFEITKPNYSSKLITDIKKINTDSIHLDFSGIDESRLFRETGWFDLLIGSAIILGGTAAYYKIKADKEYDLYQQNDDQKHLNNTDKYDLYSGLAFGALQVNFGFILYFLLSD